LSFQLHACNVLAGLLISPPLFVPAQIRPRFSHATICFPPNDIMHFNATGRCDGHSCHAFRRATGKFLAPPQYYLMSFTSGFWGAYISIEESRAHEAHARQKQRHHRHHTNVPCSIILPF